MLNAQQVNNIFVLFSSYELRDINLTPKEKKQIENYAIFYLIKNFNYYENKF